MCGRYRKALVHGGKAAFTAAVKEDAQLLESLGLRLLSVQGGLSTVKATKSPDEPIHPWEVMNIDMKVWDWLQPILAEKQTTALAAK